YLELVKDRAHGDEGNAQSSAARALRVALSTYLRLLAPFIPFATEEAWSWFNEGSVHTASWPTADELSPHIAESTDLTLSVVGRALIGIRGAKTNAKVSQKTEAVRVEVSGTEAELAELRSAERDLKAVGRIQELVLTPSADRLEIVNVSLD